MVSIFIFYASTQTLMFADDYFYATFLRGGLSEFMERNIWHYQHFNGRVFVHLLAQITLYFGTALFPFVNFAFLLVIGMFSYNIQDFEDNKYHFITYTTFFMAMFMLLDISILRESYLWASASFNYTLGTLMLVLLLFFYKRYAETKKYMLCAVIFSFLAGATTEQMGITSVLILSLMIIIDAVRKKCSVKKSLLFLVPCLIGLATIFLSPATTGRLEADTLHHVTSFHLPEFVSLFLMRFTNLSRTIYASNFAVIFAIFGALLALATYFDDALRKLLRIGFLYSAIVLALHFLPALPRVALIFSALSLIFFLFCAVLLLQSKNHAFPSLLIFSALFSLFSILFTNAQDPRVAFPAILLIMAASSSFLPRYKSLSAYILPPFVLLSCLLFLPTLFGLRENHIVMQENINHIHAAREQGGNIYYNIDFRDTHRHFLAHENGFFYEHFRNFHRIEDFQDIYFFSDIYAPIYTSSGTRLTMPVHYVENELMFPISLVIHALGGKVSWTPFYTHIDFHGTEYILDTQTHTVSAIQNGEIHYYDLSGNIFQNLRMYWYAEDMFRIFGISYEYTNGKYILHFEA